MSEEKAFKRNITEQFYSHKTNQYNINLDPKNPARNLQSNETWGDGHRTYNEQWDDFNTKNGDGCSSEWMVEKGYICTGGSNTTADEWKRCPVGYKHFRYFENTGYDNCIPETEAYNVIFCLIIVVLAIGMIKYFAKEFIRVYKFGQQNNEEVNRRIKDANNIEFHR